MHADTAPEAGGRICIALHPNRSLSPRAMAGLFVVLVLAALALGAIFATQHAWPVVVYVGLELLAAGAVLVALRRQAQDCDLLVFDDRHLQVIHRRCYRETRHDFPRQWTRLVVEPAGSPRGTPRVLVRAHGREVELGAQLAAAQRLALARRLRPLIPIAAMARPASRFAFKQKPDQRRSANGS